MIDLNDLVGKPFKDAPDEAYGPHGYSCYGLVWEVYRRFGIEIPKTNIAVTACRQTSMKEIEEQAAKYWEQIAYPEVPCAVLIRSANPDFADHVGAYIGNGKMLHVSLQHNVEVARLEAYRNKIIGYYQFVGERR